MTVRRLTHLINIALVFFLVALGLGLYPNLPERIPTHFGLDGQADGFAPRSAWWTMIWIQIGIAAFLTGLAFLLTDRALNHKLLRKGHLTRAQQFEIADRSRTILLRTTTLMLVLAISLTVSIYQAVATGRLGIAFFLALVLTVAYPMISGIRLNIDARRLLRENAQTGVR